MSDKHKECTCKHCVSACHVTPGWFLPGEAEKVAKFLKMPFEKFAEKYLIKDHCSNQSASRAPYVWSPRKIGADLPTDKIRPAHTQEIQGTCVFLKDDRCSIHKVKPYECAKTMGCDFKWGVRDDIENAYLKEDAPLGMRPEPARWDDDE